MNVLLTDVDLPNGPAPLPVLDAVPAVRGRRGRPRRRPDSSLPDHGDDHDVYRDQVHARGNVPAIAPRGTLHATGPGTYRRAAERTFARLHGFRRLRTRRVRRADSHEPSSNSPAA